jgi:RimJ/RimL family protein N-acetyltransferase
MFNEILETKRLILRPFRLEDIFPSFEMERNPEINKYTNDGGVKNYEEVEKLIEKVINEDYKENGFGRFALELKETSEFIGFCGLKLLRESNEVDLGYRIKMKYWGRGIATEASKVSLDYGFNKLQLREIVAFVIPENIKSIRVLEKFNFKYEDELFEEGELINKYKLKRVDYLAKE